MIFREPNDFNDLGFPVIKSITYDTPILQLFGSFGDHSPCFTAFRLPLAIMQRDAAKGLQLSASFWRSCSDKISQLSGSEWRLSIGRPRKGFASGAATLAPTLCNSLIPALRCGRKRECIRDREGECKSQRPSASGPAHGSHFDFRQFQPKSVSTACLSMKTSRKSPQNAPS
jgi:hypothetical protein